MDQCVLDYLVQMQLFSLIHKHNTQFLTPIARELRPPTLAMFPRAYMCHDMDIKHISHI